jgi:hypothetical protein
MDNFLQNKKILFLTTNFFQYEKSIIQEMEKLGATVDFYDERPSNNNFGKGVIRVAPRLFSWKTNRYYNQILSDTKDKKYDFFLLIKGEATPLSFLKKFRKQHPESSCIFYAYDSVEEYPKFLKLQQYFDKVFTFEARDSQKYNWHFRPLFYIDAYQTKVTTHKIYDLSFVGSAHTDRYFISEKIEKELHKNKLSSFFYYYAPSRIIFYLKRIFDSHFKKFDIRKINTQPLSHESISKIYQQSIAILDINKPFQFGMSMRPFESLAAERKLVTTNPEIIHYPFYNPNNILIIDREQPNIPKDFFQTEFQPLPKEQLEMLTIQSWLEGIFKKNQDNYWKWW